jgi:hypothetical protein
MNSLKKTFRHKGYSNNEIMFVLAPKQSFKQKEKPAGITAIMYQQAVSNTISRLLSKFTIKRVYIPVKKSIHIL